MCKKYLLSLAILFNVAHIQAVVHGSYDSVKLFTPTTFFPKGDTDNEIHGFSYLKGGLALENSDTTCTYNAFYPVSGKIELNGGALILQQDLSLANGSKLWSGGTIDGNNYALHFASTETVVLPVQDQKITATVLDLVTSLTHGC